MRKSNREHLRNEEEFQSFYWTLIHQSGLGRIADYPQHGSTSRLMHSVAVMVTHGVFGLVFCSLVAFTIEI